TLQICTFIELPAANHAVIFISRSSSSTNNISATRCRCSRRRWAKKPISSLLPAIASLVPYYPDAATLPNPAAVADLCPNPGISITSETHDCTLLLVSTPPLAGKPIMQQPQIATAAIIADHVHARRNSSTTSARSQRPTRSGRSLPCKSVAFVSSPAIQSNH
ncbi:hypothetical protein ACLOJK_012473, partial [Asimina triloba]